MGGNVESTVLTSACEAATVWESNTRGVIFQREVTPNSARTVLTSQNYGCRCVAPSNPPWLPDRKAMQAVLGLGCLGVATCVVALPPAVAQQGQLLGVQSDTARANKTAGVEWLCWRS